MANYYATTRSNYFRVRVPGEFEVLCEGMGLEYWTKISPEHPDDVFYAIASADPDGAGWPSAYWSDDVEDFIDFDVETFVQQHIDPRDVAILLEVGHEKLRYLHGYAVAVAAAGAPVSINLTSIVDLARAAFGDAVGITLPQY